MNKMFRLVEIATGSPWGDLECEDDYKENITLYDDGRIMLITEVQGRVYVNPIDTGKWKVVWG